MKQNKYRKHETCGGTGQEQGYEQISRNDEAGKWVEAGQKTIGDCVPDLRLGWSLEGDLGHSSVVSCRHVPKFRSWGWIGDWIFGDDFVV